jgi:hypothetical protein
VPIFRRLFRSAIVFAVIIAAYQAYALLAVPLMEPPLKVRESRRASPRDLDEGHQIVTKYQLLLRNYFPEGHWTQRLPPKVFASSDERAMLVLDAYKRVELQTGNDRTDADSTKGAAADVQIKIDRFALLIFPTPPREGITPPQDVIILEAPQGAVLQFDDFRPEQGRIGQIIRGQFPGRITIRSNMHDPGPDDDLLVETADLEMNTRRLFTTSPVRFRMGQNVGGGRELEIRFLADEHVQPHSTGFKFAGIDSLDINREVRMRLQLETESLLPGEDETGSHAQRGNSLPSRPGGDAAGVTLGTLVATRSVEVLRSHAERGNEGGAKLGNENPPVELSCSGPFQFDFVRYVASVDRDVVLRQIQPNGPSDQLTCNQLEIHFAPTPLVAGQADPVIVDPGKRQQRELGRLEPAAIVAEGLPVVVTSPSRGAEARGDRIQIWLRDRRVMITGEREVRLMYGPNVLCAPAIDYQHPAPQSAAALGKFRATGPGSLHYVPDPSKPQQSLNASWERLVELRRDTGQPVLALEGRPQLAFADSGAIVADGISVLMRELPTGAGTNVGVPISGGQRGPGGERQMRVVPERLTATGRVEIQSRQVTGRTHEVVADFTMPVGTGKASANGSAQASAANKSAATGLAQFNLAPGAEPARQAFHIDADRIQVQVKLQDQSVVPSSVVCDGHVVLYEVPFARNAEQPLEIRGGKLTIDQLDTGAARIRLTGGGPGAPAAKPVQLQGRGITMLSDVVELDQRENRLWSNGPGKATLLVTRDLNGRVSTSPIPLEISWQDGLEFNGRTVVFRQGVVVSGTDDTLRCDQLSVRLSAPMQFGQQMSGQAVDLEEAECRGNVLIDHRSRDAVGIVSHERLQLARLTVNQQTGVFSGDGPGTFRSTRYSAGLGSLADPAKLPGVQNGISPNGGGAGSKLYFLGVDFQRGLKGNIYIRELTLDDRVRTVYGPVDSWEQELDVSRPETLPPDSVRLLCDELRVNEDPISGRAAAAGQDADSRPIGYVQLQATHNVRIDGHLAQQGPFVAQANRASYEQAKDVFLLEGDLRVPATIWITGMSGPPPAFRKVSFNRSTGKYSGQFLYLEFTPDDVENARRAGAIRQ